MRTHLGQTLTRLCAGDVFLYDDRRAESWYHCETWPKSLACRYMQSGADSANYTQLMHIIRAYGTEQDLPDAETAVVHLRVGMRDRVPAWSKACVRLAQHPRHRTTRE